MSGILLVTTSYPGGGQPSGSEAAGAFVRDFADALSGHISVTVVAPSLEGEGCDVTEAGTEVFRFGVPFLPLSLLRPLNPAHLGKILSTLNRGRRAVIASTRKSEPEHILALWALPSGYWAMKASRVAGIPYSTWSLGSDIWKLSGVRVVSEVLQKVLRNASNRFADGIGLCRDVERISGKDCTFLPSSRVLPCDPSSPAHRESAPWRLAFLGRWHPNKGVDILLDALEELDDRTWASIEKVRIHGGGPLETQVRRRTSALAGSGRPVECGGYLDKAGAVSLYMDTDYLIIPSRIESIPLVFSDAMQCGLPVICTPAGDLQDLIRKHGAGLCSDEISASSLATAIGLAVSGQRDGYLRRTGTAAEEFSIEHSAEAFLGTIHPRDMPVQ